MPIAINCWVVPGAIDGFPGVIAIATSPGTTAIENDPLIPPMLALIEHAPPLMNVVTKPPAATEHTVASDELHFAVAVRS